MLCQQTVDRLPGDFYAAQNVLRKRLSAECQQSASRLPLKQQRATKVFVVLAVFKKRQCAIDLPFFPKVASHPEAPPEFPRSSLNVLGS